LGIAVKAYEVREPNGLDGLMLNADRRQPEPLHEQILVRVRAASLNYRDQGVIKGRYGYTKFPVIPMCDGAGEVVALGPGVTQFKVGDRIASTFFQTWTGGRIPPDASKNSLGGQLDGVLAEYIALSQNGAIRIPDHLSFEEAATLPCAALTAWNALIETGGIKSGETVAILGTGGVSCFGIAFAKMHGACVFLTSSSDAKLERGKGLGADSLINYKSLPDWDKEVLRRTDGVGVDHVVEVGGAGTFAKSFGAIRVGGKISMIGNLSGPASELNPGLIMGKRANIQGISVGSTQMFEALNRAISANAIKPVIDKVFGFDDAKAAYQHMASGAHFGKIVIWVG
jgi:NADPH:quinone reductase-like Zn-dependent oxidoreductase